MTQAQVYKIAIHFLSLAADEYSCHWCNDFDLTEIFPPTEALEVTREIDRWRGDDDTTNDTVTMDTSAMRFAANWLKEKEGL